MKRIMTRIAACSLAVLLAFNTVAIPKSKAVALGSQFASAVTAAFMTATGFSMSANGDWSGSSADMYIADRLDGFLRDFAEARDMTKAQFEEVIYDGVEIVHGGLVKISSGAAALLGGFSDWLIDKLGLIPGGESVPVYSDSGWFVNGEPFPVVYYRDWLKSMNFELNKVYTTSSGNEFYFRWEECPEGGIDDSGKAYNGLVLNGERVAGGANFYDSSAVGFCIVQSSQWVADDGQAYFIVYTGSFPDDCTIISQDMSSTSFYISDIFGEHEDITVGVSLGADYEAPPKVEEQRSMVIDTGMTFADEQAFIDAVLGGVASGSFAPTYTIEIATGGDVVVPDEDTDTQAGILGWVKTIAQRVSALPQSIAEAVKSVFVPDAALTAEITDTFSEKFAFVPQLHALGTDLLNMGPDSGPPVVYIHLEDAEGTIDYGGTVKALDMSWYERYKEDGDRIIGGFLWLGFLWALFMRVSDIINGAGMAYVLGQPTIYTPEPPNDAPRLEGSRKRGKR